MHGKSDKKRKYVSESLLERQEEQPAPPDLFKKFIKMCLFIMNNIEEMTMSPQGEAALKKSDMSVNDTKKLLFTNKLPVIYRKLGIQDEHIKSVLNESIPYIYKKMLDQCTRGTTAQKEALFEHVLNQFAQEIETSSAQPSDTPALKR